MRGIANLASRVCVPLIIHRWGSQVNREMASLTKSSHNGWTGNGPFGPKSRGIGRMDLIWSNHRAEFLDLFPREIAES